MEDIEEIYEEGIEKENEEFIEGLKQNKKIKDVEKNYKKDSKELRNKYEKEYRKKLNKEKKQELKKISEKTKPKKRQETKPYEVKNLDMNLDWKQKARVKGVKKIYKIKRKAIDLYQENYPEKIIYLRYKTQKRTNKTLNSIKKFFTNNFDIVYEEIKGFLKFLKKFFKQSSKKIKEELNAISGKILRRKKKKEISETKKEENK